MGSSHSKVTDSERAEANISEQISSSCDFVCEDVLSGATIDLIHTDVGGDINLTQACTVDANCTQQASIKALANVFFSQKNSSQASNAGSILEPLNFDSSTINSRMDVQENLNLDINQHCGVSSIDEINNVTIFAEDSNIGGSIQIGQVGGTDGSCAMSTTMSAAATATGYQQSTSYSGKDKKAQKFGKSNKSSKMAGVAGLGGLVVVIIVVVVIAHSMSSKKKKKPPLKKKPLPPSGKGKKPASVPGTNGAKPTTTKSQGTNGTIAALPPLPKTKEKMD